MIPEISDHDDYSARATKQKIFHELSRNKWWARTSIGNVK